MKSLPIENEVLRNFEKDQAEAYDERFEALSPIKDALHLATQLALEALPENANILIVGAGTGAEILYLAGQFENWSFTVVEPSEDMMRICIKKLEAAGCSARCQYHTGFLSELPSHPVFHAATSLLVSHFFMDLTQREDFFREILIRLCPEGWLVTADLSADENNHEELWEIWLRAIKHTGLTTDQKAGYSESVKSGVALVTDSEMKELLARAGFNNCLLLFQVLSIRGWLARK